MSSKNKGNNSLSSKTSSRFTNSRPSTGKSTRSKVTNPRRVLPSKKTEGKTCSAGILYENKKTTPKIYTQSDFSVKKPDQVLDFCKRCGDAISASRIEQSDFMKDQTRPESTIIPGKPSVVQKPIQQYYKNENYHPTTDSVEDLNGTIKRISLDTIKEVSDKQTESIFKIYPDSEEDITYVDTDDQECIQQLKEFREKNYFECHSANSRVRNKASATSLQNHRCVYRFYLNDRLFPVPLSTDHNNQVRCVECHLPMELNVEDSTKINGTIQAKVTLGKKTRDVMLLLPVREPLIITEKRKEERNQKEVVYFGLINLDSFGNSMFNSTLPTNSFALKYQRGYKEFETDADYSYKELDKNDVVVI